MGGLIQTFGVDPDAALVEYSVNEDGELEPVSETGFFLDEIMESYSYGIPDPVAPSGSGSGTSILKLYYHNDRLGSTSFLTGNDTDGKVVSYVTYDDWGALTSKVVLRNGNRELDLVLQYTVHPFDQVLGVYFAQARMYDAVDQRFMAMDLARNNIAYPQTFNQYMFVLGNPLKYIDPNGLAPEKVVDGVINVGKNGIYTVYYDNDTGKVYVDFYEVVNTKKANA